MAWQIRLSFLSSVTCVPTQGFNFSRIFLHYIVAWPSGNSSTKNHEDRPRGSPPPKGLNRWSNRPRLAISSPDEFLVKRRPTIRTVDFSDFLKCDSN